VTVRREAVRLAKLAPPRIFAAVARERLFALLDERLRQPAVWVAGPPGAGKTTLVASCLDARKRHALWYQVDRGDADIATFFHYIALAADRLDSHRARRLLPALTPEYLPDLAGFARRFFRQLFARLPGNSLVVFDNLDEVPAQSALHGVIATALAELPQGLGCILVSRKVPPPSLARSVANQTLGMVGWHDLRLTEPEAAAIAAARSVTEEAIVRACFHRSRGWVAGLILMLSRSDKSTTTASLEVAAHQSLFSYFAATLFDELPVETRDFLLATAMLPSITAPLAALVCDHPHAERTLRDLYEANCFIDRRAESEPVYQLHALFREFLLDRVDLEFDSTRQQRSARRAADALASVGRLDEAVPLYGRAGDWDKFVQITLRIAPHLIAQGRWPTLRQWIADLPRDRVDAIPWVQYWRGAAEAAADRAAARRILSDAFDAFERAGDAFGQMHAAAAILESQCVALSDFVLARRWVAALEGLLEAHPDFPTPDDALQVLSSLTLALLITHPQNPRLPVYARRLLPLIDGDADANLRACGTIALLDYCTWIGELETARRACTVAHDLVAEPAVLPNRKVRMLIEVARFAYARAEHAEGGAIFDTATRLIHDHGLDGIELFLNLRDAWRRLDLGDCRHVASVLHRAETGFESMRRGDTAHLHFVAGWLALLEGDLAKAQHEEELALALAAEIGWAHAESCDLLMLAQIMAERGDCAKAAEYAGRFRARFASIGSAMFEFHVSLVEAYIAHRQGDEGRCAEALRSALAVGRQQGYVNTLCWYAPMMARLAAFALRDGIEPDYARMLIRRRGLTPQSEDPPDNWPWPIRIHTLGRFEIRRDDMPIAFEGKAQHRPLDLLKAMIALGGRDIAVDRLIDAIWPDPLDDHGQKVFDITVHRLRKLLDANDAVRIADRHATLNPAIVWVDAWALEGVLARLVPAVGSALPGLRALEDAAPRVLDLYRGHFLAGDTDHAWHVPLRNRLSGRFARFVLRLGELWESDARLSSAAELYQRAIEIDPLAETFYRRRMVCLHAQGQRAEAIGVFRQCRQTLAIVLGVTPTSETDAVYRSLLDR
jgi:ATP/maltotriose-dependent transcriptional regulator MalT/DNA-binding SARP family transcriptional activator